MKSHKKKTLSNSEVKMKILNYGSCNIDYVYNPVNFTYITS